MKILIDSQCFYFTGRGGISRYFTEIISGFDRDPDLEIYFQEHSVYNYFASSIGYKQGLKGLNRLKYEREKRANRRFVKKILTSDSCDLFVPTYYDPYFLNYRNNTLFVLVVHDMIPEKHFSEKFNDLILNKYLLCQKAASIICVSENTKAELLKHYPDLEDKKIDVIYHGSSLLHLESKSISIPKNYFLFVGNREGYKNFNFFLNEVIPLLRSNPDLHLICAGGKRFSKKEKMAFISGKVTSQVLWLNPNDRHLKYLYEHAHALVVPSLEEGFGIPLIEAMQSSCLLVLSDIPVFREVASDHAFYFKPWAQGELTQLLEMILMRKTGTKEQITAAKVFSQKYNWENTLKETKNLYLQTI